MAAPPCFPGSSDLESRLPELRRRAAAPPPSSGGTMSTAIIARPEAEESSAYYHRYIARVSDESLAQQLIEQAREVEREGNPGAPVRHRADLYLPAASNCQRGHHSAPGL